MSCEYKIATLDNGFCMNSDCDKYWEDMCILSFENQEYKLIYPYTLNTTIEKSKERCEHYKKGKCNWYHE